MRETNQTIADLIDHVSRRTGASEPFTEQVRELFLKKGITLDSNAGPYYQAIEEAFNREQTIRATSQRAKENIQQLRQNFSKIGTAYSNQLDQLKKIQSKLQAQTRRMMKQQRPVTPTAGSKGSGQSVAIRGDHRSYVTRPEREELPLVPGPKELQ
jgi:hypothetical protein